MKNSTWRIGCVALALVGTTGGCEREEEPVQEVRMESRRSQGSEQTGSARTQAQQAETAPSAESRPSSPAPGENAPPAPAPVDPALLDPSSLTEQAPPRYVVELTTTEGPVHIEVDRSWAPEGADRFYNLVKAGYFTDVSFFRVVDGFMAQVGIHGSPEVSAAWRTASIPDDPVVQSNTRGMVTFATSGPNSRTTQFFINFGDNSRLDAMGFAPFGRVRPADMAVVDRLHAGYGEGAPAGRGPMQALIQRQGNEYLRAQFPELDYIQSARIVEP